jgi:uncharacterized membrane protein
MKEIDLINNKLKERITPVAKEEEKTEPKKIIPEPPSKLGNIELITEPKPKIEAKITPTSEPTPIIKEKAPVTEPTPEAQAYKTTETTFVKTGKTREKRDLEKFIGENLLSKIGILLLVLGMGYFVKYAIDKNWINEYGRVAIGVLTGGILIGIANWLRNSYKTFSSILIGGGFAVLYITISIAFHEYELFSQSTAFVILVIITIFSVLLSLVYDKKELAIFSQIGGLASPFMVSTGEGNYHVLFSYLLILNAGLIVIAYYKRWHILNLLAFIFTQIIYNSWLYSKFTDYTPEPFGAALVYASLFYLVFFLVNALNNIKERKPFNAIEIIMILSNNLLFFLSGLYILHHLHDGAFKGLFTVLIGLYNFGWVVYLYSQKQIDKTFIYLLIGLVMSYVSLAIPIQLEGHSITLFWSAEIVILVWLSQKSGIQLLKIGHFIIIALTGISLMMDWYNLYIDEAEILPVVANQAFITGIVVMAALGFTIFLLNQEKETSFIKNLIKVSTYRNILGGIIFIGLYFVLFAEINYQMNRAYDSYSLVNTIYALFNFTYLAIFLILCRKLQWETIIKILYIPALLLLLVFLIYYNDTFIDLRKNYFFSRDFKTSWFLFHYIVYVPVAWMLWFSANNRKLLSPSSNAFPNIVLWFITVFVVITASIELDSTVIALLRNAEVDYYDTLEWVHKVGYPILWGICAFILIVIGIRMKNKVFRIQAICLIGLILLKLIAFDVWDMNEGGRIAAFIFVGVVLLVISFLYQKLKRFILVEDEKGKE